MAKLLIVMMALFAVALAEPFFGYPWSFSSGYAGLYPYPTYDVAPVAPVAPVAATSAALVDASSFSYGFGAPAPAVTAAAALPYPYVYSYPGPYGWRK